MDHPSRATSAWRKYLQCVGPLVIAAVAIVVGGCAQHRSAPSSGPTAIARPGYRVNFAATRLKDHSALASTGLTLGLSRWAAVRTSSTVATEEAPALPRLAAQLTATKSPGVFQLITKVAIREAARNKKGKLKFSKRIQGALLPIRPGETQSASPAGDPIQIEIRLERL